MDKTQIGFLLSLIPFAGLVALFISSWVARFGFKRTYVLFFGVRKVITIGLLLTPWVASRFGSQGLLIFITLIMGGFSLSRAIAETGFYPWVQEYIPNSVRGKYSATEQHLYHAWLAWGRWQWRAMCLTAPQDLLATWD